MIAPAVGVILFALAAAGAVAAETVSSLPDRILERLDNVVGTGNGSPSAGLDLRLNAVDGVYRAGDLMVFEIRTAAATRHVYLDYYQLDGNVVHILPAPDAYAKPLTGGSTLTIGNEETGARFEVLAPFGRELIVLIASPVPLFDAARREFEDAGQYLSALQAGLEKVNQAGAAAPGVVRRFVTTYAKDAVIAAAPPARPAKPAPSEPAASPPAATPAVKSAAISTDKGEGDVAALPATPSEAAPEAGDHLDRISRLLSRLEQAPNDQENLDRLVAAYAAFARDLMAEGKYREAEWRLATAVALDPSNPRLTELQQALQARTSADAEYRQGVEQLTAGDIDLAYASFSRVMTLEPKNTMARKQLENIRPMLTELYHKRAMVAFRRQDLDGAVAIWDKLLAIDPTHERAKLNRGMALDLKKRLRDLKTDD